MVSSVDQFYQLHGRAIDSSRECEAPNSWAMSTNGANDGITSVSQ